MDNEDWGIELFGNQKKALGEIKDRLKEIRENPEREENKVGGSILTPFFEGVDKEKFKEFTQRPEIKAIAVRISECVKHASLYYGAHHIEVDAPSRPDPNVVFIGDGFHEIDVSKLEELMEVYRTAREASEFMIELLAPPEFTEPFIDKPERTYKRDHEKTRFKFKKSGKVRRKR